MTRMDQPIDPSEAPDPAVSDGGAEGETAPPGAVDPGPPAARHGAYVGPRAGVSSGVAPAAGASLGAGRLQFGVRCRLSRGVIGAMRTASTISAVVLSALALGGLGATWILFDPPDWILGIAAAAAGVFVVWLWLQAWFWPPIWYRHVSYRVESVGLEIRRGVFWRHTHFVPRSRVQHTDVTQGPLQRKFGVARLTLHTAGTVGSSVELTGIARDEAVRLRDFFMEDSGADDAV